MINKKMILICFLLGTILLPFNFIRLSDLAISDLLFFASLLFLFLHIINSNKIFFECNLKNYLVIPIYLIVIGTLISLIKTQHLRIAITEGVQQLFVITLFLYLICFLVERGYSQLIINIFIVSGVLAATISIIDFSFNTNIGPLLSGSDELFYRFAGPLGHPNKFGMYLAITSSLTFSVISYEKFRYFLFPMLILLIQIFGIYLSGSITAFIGFIAVLFLNIAKDKNIRKIFILVFVVIAVIIICTSFDDSSNLMIAMFENISRNVNRVVNYTARSRILTYSVAFQSIQDNPITGIGLDQLSTSSLRKNQRLLSSSVHNLLLQIFYCGGIVSFLGWFVLYMMILFFSLRVLLSRIKHKKLTIILAISVLSIILMDQFQDVIYQREKWLAIGLFLTNLPSKRQ